MNDFASAARARASTCAVRTGIDRDPAFGAVTPPLVLSSNFSFAGFNEKRRYDYTRSGNPTRDLLGEALAALEGGAGGVVTATGMAAVTVVLHALLQPGDVLVVPHDGYGGSWRLFNALASKGAFELLTCDLTDPRALAEALARQPALVWIETPSNPLLRITDLRATIAAAHAAGARAVVDNTFLSPLLQRPIAEFGADVVVHSTTKYINGHSDVVGGAVVAKDAGLHAELAWWANALGLTGSPFDSFLTLRGLRTLDARMRVHQENATAIAALLDGHPAVRALHWPGLPAHPGHAIAARQQHGFGAMLSVELHGGGSTVIHRSPSPSVAGEDEDAGTGEPIEGRPHLVDGASCGTSERVDGLRIRCGAGVHVPRVEAEPRSQREEVVGSVPGSLGQGSQEGGSFCGPCPCGARVRL